VEQEGEEELYIQFEEKDEQHLVKFSEIVRALQSVGSRFEGELGGEKEEVTGIVKG